MKRTRRQGKDAGLAEPAPAQEDEGWPTTTTTTTCWVPEVQPNPLTQYYATRNPQGAQPVLSVLVPLWFTPEQIMAREFGFDHRESLTCFGGVRPWLRKDEEWPRCGHCSHHLQFFCQIDFRHLPPQAARQYAGGERNRLLQMFVCSLQGEECRVWEAFDESVLLRFVPLPPAGGPSLLTLASRVLAESLPSFPDKETVRDTLRLIGLDTLVSTSADIGPNEDTTAQLAKCPRLADDGTRSFAFALPFHRPVRWRASRDWPNEEQLADGSRRVTKHGGGPTYAGTKLGGWAHRGWSQGGAVVKYPACRECGRDMTNLVFHISEDDILPYDWGDSAPHIVLQCPVHYAELAFQYLC